MRSKTANLMPLENHLEVAVPSLAVKSGIFRNRSVIARRDLKTSSVGDFATKPLTSSSLQDLMRNSKKAFQRLSGLPNETGCIIELERIQIITISPH